MPSEFMLDRRAFLGQGLAGVALIDMLAREGLLSNARADEPQRQPSAGQMARAKHVVWIFLSGGPSQVDTFDPKPELERFAGQPYSGDEKRIGTAGRPAGTLMPSPLTFQPRGDSGILISELFPKIGEFADDLCIVRSMFTDSAAHGSACLQANLGTGRIGSPSLGSWISQGLGSLKDNLPSFVVMHDPRGGPNSGSANWSAGFLPSSYQGTVLRPTGPPLIDLHNPPGVTDARQRRLLDTLAKINTRHAQDRSMDPELLARIQAYETAYRLQHRAVELVDLGQEPKPVLESYGIGEPEGNVFGRQCLLARRLVERGVKFVQIYSGAAGTGNSWDGHIDCARNHRMMAAEIDSPVAALLADLKRTGLWRETLVVCMGEFGRTPTADGYGKLGRDHNPHGFFCWLAGAGIKGGQAIGQTDELGLKAVESPYHVSDLLGTILLHVGLDPDDLRRDASAGMPNLFGRTLNPILPALS